MTFRNDAAEECQRKHESLAQEGAIYGGRSSRGWWRAWCEDLLIEDTGPDPMNAIRRIRT